MKYHRIIIVVFLLIGLACTMSACGQPYTCDFCMKEKTSKQHAVDLYGEEIIICDECYNDFYEIANN